MDDRARMLPTLPPLAVADVVSRESAFTMTRPPIAVRVTSRAYAWVVPRTMENTSAPDTAPLRIAPAIEIARALASTTWSASASIRTPASVAVIVEPMANAETVLVTVLSDLDRPDAAPAMRLPVPLSSSTEASIPELSRAWTRTPPRVARTTESSRMKASTVAVVWLDECAPASAWASEMVETEMPSAAGAEVVVPMSLTAMDLATPAAAPPPAAPLMLAAMAPARALMLEPSVALTRTGRPPPPVTVLSTISAWVEPLMLLLATDPAPVKEIPAPEPPASPPATPITVDLTVKADFASTATNPPPVTVDRKST